jgi:hypothetical protein
VVTLTDRKWRITCGLSILLLVACSGGGDGGIDFVGNSDGNILTKSLVLENEPLSVSYTQSTDSAYTILASFPGYASNIEEDIILALEQTHDPNCRCNYEIFYTTPSE